jgi:preprotein translocase subunit SecF
MTAVDTVETAPAASGRGLVYRLYHGETDYDFPRGWRYTRWFSLALLLISIGSLALRGLNLGIEFEGGTSWEVTAPGVSVETARDTLRPVGQDQARIQIVGGDTLRIESSLADPARAEEVAKELGKIGTVTAQQSVGPSWGNEITHKALVALVVFFVLLAIYISIQLEWKMAVGAILAVVHDIAISVGVYSVLGLQVTPATVVSFLTILGYSLYDTVVVFDKVRELSSRHGKHPRDTYTSTMNTALNRVLMRSINTTLMGVLPVLAMLIVGGVFLGGTTLEDFAVALLVGLLIGAYSSIYVAAPIVAWLKEREPRYASARERLDTTDSAPLRSRTVSAAAATGRAMATTAVATPESGSTAASTAGVTIAEPRSPMGNHPPRPRKKKKR